MGAVDGNGGVSVAGAVASIFFFPALAAARAIREDNMAIRLLEIALDKASTADEAAKALNEAFTRLFVEESDMTSWRWFPALRPRHSVHAVLRELIAGLENGSIVLEKDSPPHATLPAALPPQGTDKREATNGTPAPRLIR
jgi:hypothetical protein